MLETSLLPSTHLQQRGGLEQRHALRRLLANRQYCVLRPDAGVLCWAARSRRHYLRVAVALKAGDARDIKWDASELALVRAQDASSQRASQVPQEQVSTSAELLMQVLHARWLCTTAGLAMPKPAQQSLVQPWRNLQVV
jgi:hypothetical protein